jgi:hypothetical protein
MKTIKNVEKEIQEQRAEIEKIKSDLKEGVKILPVERRRKMTRYKNALKRIKFLKEMIKYLETSPAEDFLKKEEDRLCNRLEKIEDERKRVCSNIHNQAALKAKTKEFNKLMDVVSVKTYLKNIRFLLNK